MNTAGLPELWHVTLAILSRQEPFVAILLVTLAALFVVMALEGFRSSLKAIWLAHRTTTTTTPSLDAPAARLAAPAVFAPRTRSFTAKPRATRPKALDQSPRQFRTPRPTIRRAPAEEYSLREAPSGEGASVTGFATFPLSQTGEG